MALEQRVTRLERKAGVTETPLKPFVLAIVPVGANREQAVEVALKKCGYTRDECRLMVIVGVASKHSEVTNDHQTTH